MADEYTPTSWVDGVPPYIDAEHLNKIEAELVRLGTQLAAIKAAYLGKSAISNVQVNDQNKVPSSALVYGMNEDISVLNSNLNTLLSRKLRQTQVTTYSQTFLTTEETAIPVTDQERIKNGIIFSLELGGGDNGFSYLLGPLYASVSASTGKRYAKNFYIGEYKITLALSEDCTTLYAKTTAMTNVQECLFRRINVVEFI